MIMEKKQSFLINELLLNLKELPKGFYAKDNIEIRIFQNEHNEVIYEIKQDNIILNIKYSKGLDRYNSTLNISKDNINLSFIKSSLQNNYNTSCNKKINDNEYIINDNIFYKNNVKEKQIYMIYSDKFIRILNENCRIGYDFKDKKPYVFYKKFNTIGDNISKDYVKIEYNDNFIREKYSANLNISTIPSTISKNLTNKGLIELIYTISFPKLKINLEKEIKELVESLKIYEEMKEHLNIKNYNYFFEDISRFINEIINKPMEIQISTLKYTIKNADYNNIYNLKELRKELKKRN